MKISSVFLSILIISFVASKFYPYDETDDLINKERSGLSLYTDYGTGCQYLRTLFGGLQPRLAPDGKQICKK